MKKKIIIFGATGNTGSYLLEYALNFFNKEELWKLMGNVHIQNLKGEQFDTELLYWDQRTQRIYSDEFIRIEQPDRIITGHGFESNQQMTVYTIRKPEGIFYVDEETAAADSLQTDTIN